MHCFPTQDLTVFRYTSAVAVVDIYHCRRTFCYGFVPPEAFQPSQLDRAGLHVIAWALPPDPSKLLSLPGLKPKTSVMGALMWVTGNIEHCCFHAQVPSIPLIVSVWLGPQLVFYANILL